MSNSELGMIHAFGKLGTYLSSLETAVFEVLHLDPNIYFRTLPPIPRPVNEELVAEAKRFYASNVFLFCFWILVWTFSLYTYGNPRHGILTFHRGFVPKVTLVLIKVWILCAGMGYLVFGAKMEGTFPSRDVEYLLIMIKVFAWIGFNFMF